MYKTASGARKFSLLNLVNNSFPNFARDNSKNDADLSPFEQDNLFTHQLAQPNPEALSEQAFWIAGIVENKSFSPKIHKALQKNEVLDAETGSLDTTKITKHFANQLAIISVHAQRKLVGMLFFWEEELMRWRILSQEEAEIREAMKQRQEAGEGLEELQMALRVVQAKKAVLPSLRTGQAAAAADGQLPGYGEAAQPPTYR